GSIRSRRVGRRTRASWRHHMIRPRMDMSVTDLRVLVTGGSAGIGLATAALLRDEGARVTLVSRHPQEAARSIGAGAVAADLSTAQGCDRAVSTAVADMGGLDVLVNNVGGARVGRFADIDDDAWQ